MPFGSGILIRVGLTTTHFSRCMRVKKVCSEYEGVWSYAHSTAPHGVYKNHQNHWHLPPLSPQRICRNNHFAGSHRYILEAFAQHTHLWKKAKKSISNWSNKVLTRSCAAVRANEREQANSFFFGSDTDAVMHTKLNSVKSEAYLIKSCGKFSVDFVQYFRTFRSSAAHRPLRFDSQSQLITLRACCSIYVCCL